MSSWLKVSFITALALLSVACGGGSGQPAADTVAPQISISGVTEGQRLSSGVSLTISASDSSGISGLTLSLNGQEVASSPSAQLTWTLDPASRAAGVCSLTASAVDGAGNDGSRSLNLELLGAPSGDGELLPSAPAALASPDELFPILSGPDKPDFYDPVDAKLPQPIIFGLQEGDRVADGVEIKITAQDDRGVEAICARVGDGQQWYTDTASLNLNWDTTRLPDGPCVFNIYLLDRGLKVTLTEVRVEVANHSDHTGPQIQEHGKLTNYQMGQATLRFTAADPSGVKTLKLYVNVDPAFANSLGRAVPTERLLMAQAAPGGNEVVYTWRPYDAPFNCGNIQATVTVESTDSLGNLSYLSSGLTRSCVSPVSRDIIAEVDMRRVHAPVKVTAQRVADAADFGVEFPTTYTLNYPGWARGPAYVQSDLQRQWYPESPSFTATGLQSPDGLPLGLYNLTFNIDDYTFSCFADTSSEEYDVAPSLNNGQPARTINYWNDNVGLPGMEWDSSRHLRSDTFIGSFGSDLELMLSHMNFSKEWGWRYEFDLINFGRYDSLSSTVDFSSHEMDLGWIWISDGAEEAADLADPQIVSRLHSFVRDGGQLICSGSAYDYVEQAFPQMIAFSGADSDAGLSTTPQALNGVLGGSVSAGAKLQVHDLPVPTPGTAGIADGFPLIEAVDASRVFTWLVLQQTGQPSHPVLISFRWGLGTVIYSAVPLSSGNQTPLGSPGPPSALEEVYDALRTRLDSYFGEYSSEPNPWDE